MIKLLYFASIRERLEREEEEIDLPAGVITVADLFDHLAARGGVWAQVLTEPSVLVAVNQVMSQKSAHLDDGDEVAFFPPVTGG